MTTRTDYKMIEAAMLQGRMERAYAFRAAARYVATGLRNSARSLVAIFA